MKKGIVFIVLLFVFSSSFSQKQAPEKKFSFKVDGSIRNYSGKVVYVSHKSGETEIKDSARISGEKFSFNLKNTEPTLYWFSIKTDPTLVFLFADETNAKVKLIADSMMYSVVEAGSLQNEYFEYRNFINNLIAVQQKLQTDFNTAMQNNDLNAQNAIKVEYQNLNTQYMAGLKNYLKTHPKSPVSAYIIGNDLNNAAIPLSEVIEALSYIDKSLDGNSNIKSANKRVEAAKGTMVGYKATDFSQNTPEGKKVSLSDFRGKYVLIDFWASWCRPCRMENPNVVAAYARYKDKGFTVLGVSMDSNKDPWVNAIQQDNLTWTHISDLKGWGNEVGKMYGVTGIPQNYLIDKDGKIIAKDLRGTALDEKLAEIIK
ncbi:TlpA disulfide reductase family protein [Aurantibacillus circumpalustris]|uniref:TlpA disulfide reductase family protein n=1 Tax=Aurantibacillus circumpalustris TaxID=3036359 RepID=UPI00295AC044|nr:TlpA disulfide reductase family protein [Aurantibacillus circumpalustris]